MAVPSGGTNSVPMVLPDGAPDWAHALYNHLKGDISEPKAKVETLTADHQNLAAKYQDLTAEVRCLKYASSPKRLQALTVNNACSASSNFKLVPVPCSQTGNMPERFPRNFGEFKSLTVEELDALLDFYRLPPVTRESLANKRSRLANEVGILIPL